MDDELWLFDKLSRFELTWAMSASLVLHVLLALICTLPTATPQAAGSDGRFEISWAAPGEPPVPTPAVGQEPERNPSETPVAAAKPVPGLLPPPQQERKEPVEAEQFEVFLVSAPRQEAPRSVIPPAQVPRALGVKQSAASSPPEPRVAAKVRQEPARANVQSQGRQRGPAPTHPAESQPHPVQAQAAQPSPAPAQPVQARARVTLQLPPAAPEPLAQEQEDDELDATLDEEPTETEAPESEVAQLPPPQAPEPVEAGALVLSQAPTTLPTRRLAKPVAPPVPPARPVPPADAAKTAASPQPKRPVAGREDTGKKIAPVAALKQPAPKQRRLPAALSQSGRPAAPPEGPLTPPSPGLAPGPVVDRAAASVTGKAATRVALEPAPKSVPRAANSASKPETTSGAKTASRVSPQPSSPASASPPGTAPTDNAAKGVGKNTAKAAARTAKPAKPVLPKPALTKTAQQSTKKAEPAPSTPAALPSLHGDLKLVLTGNPNLKVSVRFRDYPRSRRNSTSAGAEARQQTLMTPLMAATGATTREAVIGSTQEGVYSFIVEPLHGKSTRASFKLKIYEASPRERSVNLGNRTITGPTVLLKILIPEAVLWDEEAPFTGSMEDSESEIKFNAENGLFWKEFKQ